MFRNLLCALLAWLAFAPAAAAFDVSPAPRADQVEAFDAVADIIALPSVEAIPVADVPADLMVLSDGPSFDVALAPAGRLRMGREGGTPPPPTSQTAYWGPKTFVGYGGYSPPGVALPVQSAPDTANYYWDATYGWIVPKLGANKTYGTQRGGSDLPASEVFTITDANGTVFTVDNRADVTRAGHYTVRFKPGDTQNSTTGTNQWFRSYANSAYGEEIAFRGGTTWNTTADCASGCPVGSVFNGTATFTFACAILNCLDTSGFNGSNPRIIRPELGTTVTIGPVTLDGQISATPRIKGVKFAGFTVDGEASSYTGNMLALTNGSSGISFEDNIIIGNTNSPYGKDRPNSAITICDVCFDVTIRGNAMSWLKNGISAPQHPGTSSDVAVGSAAPTTGFVYVGYNVLSEIGRDNLYTQCLRNFTIEYNLFTDKATEVTVSTGSPWLNPFDSGSQPHADHVQLNMQASGTVCAYNYYDNVVIRGNLFLRGNGRDSLPFWTDPPYPTPNASGTISSGSVAATPDPSAGLASAQGIAMTNGNWDCPAAPAPQCTAINRKLTQPGNVPRTYETVLRAPTIENNVVMSEFANGIIIQAIEGGTFTGNVAISTVPGPANLVNWSTVGFGSTGTTIANVYGTTTVVARNAAGFGSYGQGGQILNDGGSNVTTTRTALATFFQNPGANGSPRTLAEYIAAYLPIKNGPLETSPGVYAGPYCWDGSVNTGACPLSFANDNLPAHLAADLWNLAA